MGKLTFHKPVKSGRLIVAGEEIDPRHLGGNHPRVFVCNISFRLKDKYYLGNPRGQAKDSVRYSVLLHRVVYEAVHGPIPEGHEVHHIDEDTFNCHPDNLEAIPSFQHRSMHKSVARFICTCRVCGKEFGSYQKFGARCSIECKRADHARLERERRLVARQAAA